MFEVEWTGEYPNHCSGEWIIMKNNELLTLPKNVRTSNMRTFGKYGEWYCDENGYEHFEEYEDGLCFEEWIQVNGWVENITKDVNEQRELYIKISEKDWRHNSCGGCI